MKRLSLLLSFFLLFGMLACESDEVERTIRCPEAVILPETPECLGYICRSVECERYEAIWKALFLEKNNMEEAYFQEHITICRTSVDSWSNGQSFKISYRIKNGWAEVTAGDSFIVLITPGNTLHPAAALPRGTYLTAEQVKTAIDARAFHSYLTKVNAHSPVLFASQQEARQTLIEKAQVNTLCFWKVQLENTTGDFILTAAGEFSTNNNECLEASLNLMTGAHESRELPCIIN